ncbi:cellular tumor antigen p53-like [Anopheles albimanus]|uniref:p53 DNA-binding domain-containing protein n=1 Tax=Anopheles albimanus TaxID=7167 RepID=A0A182FR67_ANOAL|nr:cellular tumor antigen p53-like [Anopheles albimanus]
MAYPSNSTNESQELGTGLSQIINSQDIDLGLNMVDIEGSMISTFADRVNDDSVTSLSQDLFSDSTIGQEVLSGSKNLTGKTPSVEELLVPGVLFTVALSGDQSGSSAGWVYSDKLKKLFVKHEGTCAFTVKVECDSNSPMTSWYVRVMLVFTLPEFNHIPIQRCHNHRAQDAPECANISMHIIRCQNRRTQYIGCDGGAPFEKRCAVRVELEDNCATLALQFMCQNSCFKPAKLTGIVFTLEDTYGNVCGRRTIPIKICTNYRRDKLNEENSLRSGNMPSKSLDRNRPHKRNHNAATVGTSQAAVASFGKGRMKRERVSIEPCRISLTLPSPRMAKRVFEAAIGMISNAVLRAVSEQDKATLMTYIQTIREERSSTLDGCSQDSEIL